MNSQINLIGDKKQKALSPLLSRLQVVRFIAMSFLFVIGVASIVLFLFIAFSPLPALQQQEKNQRETLSQYETDIAQLAFVNERMRSITTLLQDRTSVDTIFQFITSKVPAGVTITAFQINGKTASITMSSDSLELLQNCINGFIAEEGQRFEQVSLGSLALDPAEQNAIATVIVKYK